MSIVSERITLSEILSSDVRDLVGNRKEASVTILRTTIDGTDSEVLNLLPPRGRIFWSFGMFATQDESSVAYSRQVQSELLARIGAAQRRLGLRKKSVNAYEFLGSVSKGMGDKFYPYPDANEAVPYWWFAQRHICLACPAKDHARYLDYFSRQLEQIGSECFHDASDEMVFVDMSQYKEHLDYQFLATYVARLPPVTRTLALRTLADSSFCRNADPDVIELVGCRNGPEIGLIEDLKNFDDPLCVQEILYRRAELAIEFSTLLCLERAYIGLAKENWRWEPAARNRMLRKMKKFLDRYPVIADVIDATE